MMTKPCPGVFLVGAMKAGTSSIAKALDYHPEVFVCPVKEPNYFCSDLYRWGLGDGAETGKKVVERVCKGERLHHAYVRDASSYHQLFQGKLPNQYAVDCSTTYLYSREAAKNIALANPEAKIIISLRDPVERAFSEFLMNVAIGVARTPFQEMIKIEEQWRLKGAISPHHRYVTAGLYCEQVKRYIHEFGEKNVLVIRFENLRDDFGGELNRIADFLGIDRQGFPDHVKVNEAMMPRTETMNFFLESVGVKNMIRRVVPKKVKEALKPYYYRHAPEKLEPETGDIVLLRGLFSEDVVRLSELVGQDFSGWLRADGNNL